MTKRKSNAAKNRKTPQGSTAKRMSGRFFHTESTTVLEQDEKHSATATAPTVAPKIKTDLRKHANFHSHILPEDRDLIVYLPGGYETHPEKHYPVLYLHDGQNLFDPDTAFVKGEDWQADDTAETLSKAGVIEPVIIVGIYNTPSRIEDYTPVKDQKKRGGQADLYGRMIVEEVKPFIDQTYRTLQDAWHTGLGGSSLGGLVSIYLGLQYPEVFGKLAVISPSVWWSNKAIIEFVDELLLKPRVKIWLDMGTAEGGRTLKDANALRDALVRKGWVLGDDLQYTVVEGGVHSERSWGERVGRVLNFLFPNGNGSGNQINRS